MEPLPCPIDADVMCIGPSPGDRCWKCPIHGAKLTWSWTNKCRTNAEYREAWLSGKGPGQDVSASNKRKPPENPTRSQEHLGLINNALDSLELSRNIVEDCLCMGSCREKRLMLRLLHSWASKQMRGLFVDRQAAIEELDELINGEEREK